MHEFSIVRSLLDLVERYVRENGGGRVTRVVVRVGVVSGADPYLLRTAFETFREGTVAEGAELEIEIERMRLRCLDCGKETEREEPRFSCPSCGSLHVEVSGGEDLILKRLEIEHHEGPAEGQD
jgi:hydrogenase nickel incorporation protein HypA/HybF